MTRHSLILASASPRRKKILERAGFKPLVFPTNVSEILDKKLSVDEQICAISRQKLAFALSTDFVKGFDRPIVVVSADTVVVIDDKIIGKPVDRNDAFSILKKLSGRRHEVKTAVTLTTLPDKKSVEFLETSLVSFRDLSDADITDYIDKFQPFDKAGAYGIQDENHGLVANVEGSLNNVVGFPIEKFIEVTKQTDIAISKHIVVAVSKLQPIEKIQNLLNKNCFEFGENYLQEALEKIKFFKNADKDVLPIRWHFIGRLQSKKAAEVVQHFDAIHSIDSLDLLKKIDTACRKQNRAVELFLQINLSGEASKGGFSISELRAALPEIIELKFAYIVGLMTMPPLVEGENPENSRIYFRQLRELRDTLLSVLPHCRELSMGTTQDYKIALEEGSTCVRLGTLLFGERLKRTAEVLK